MMNRCLSRTTTKLLTVAALLSGAFSGRAVNVSDLQRQIEFIKQRPAAPISPLPMLSIPQRPDDQIADNPFKEAAAPPVAREGVELYPDTLRVVGIVGARGGNVALVDDAGAIRVLREGDQISGARVERILGHGVTLRHDDGSTSQAVPDR